MASGGDKIRLTESGAAALKAWMETRGVSLSALGEATRTHVMWSRRLIRREGLATLEQVGLIVAYAGGELTAGQLVGLELAAQVPQLQAIGMPPPTGQVAPSAPAPAGPTLARQAPQLFELPRGSPREILEKALLQTRGETARSRLILQLIKLEEDESAKGGGDTSAMVTDLELVRRFEDLLFHCQRQWVEADELAKSQAVPEAPAHG